MKLRPFRFRPRTRVQAADKQRPKLTRERSSRIILRRRDQEFSQEKGRLVRQISELGRDRYALARLLARERRDADQRKMGMFFREDAPSPMPDMFLPDRNRQDVCQTRAVRVQVLFAKNIAGRPGKSPGKGGRYKHTETSNITCERSL